MEKQELQNAQDLSGSACWWNDRKYLKASDDGKGFFLDIPAILADHEKMVTDEVMGKLCKSIRNLREATNAFLDQYE